MTALHETQKEMTHIGEQGQSPNGQRKRDLIEEVTWQCRMAHLKSIKKITVENNSNEKQQGNS